MAGYADHATRRQQVIEVATELVVEGGLSALTARAVAARIGCSTKVVSHHFENMSELLAATYAYNADLSRARVEAVVAQNPLDLAAVIDAVLPLNNARRGDWAVWFAFWTEALTNEQLRGEQRRRARGATKRYAGILQALLAAGWNLNVTVDEAAERLGALTSGVAAQAMFDPSTWTAARQKAVVRSALDGMLSAPKTRGRKG